MIRVNLLPFRAARTKENVKRQVAIFLVLIAVFVLCCVGYSGYQIKKIGDLKRDLAKAESDLVQYKKQAAEVDKIQQEINGLMMRKKTIDSLDGNRTGPVKLLDHLTGLVAANSAMGGAKAEQRVWLESLSTRDVDGTQTIKLDGVALDNIDVSDFMKRLESLEESPAVQAPALKGVAPSGSAKEGAGDMEPPPGKYFAEVRLIKLAALEGRDATMSAFKSFSIECKRPIPGAPPPEDPNKAKPKDDKKK